MIKKSSIFQPSADQSAFLAAVSALMTFLIVLCLGVSLSLSNAVDKWSRSWDSKATIQVLSGGDIDGVRKVLDADKSKIKMVKQLSDAELSRMLKPWLHDTRSLDGYLPVQIDITFKHPADIAKVGLKLENLNNVKFISHSDAISGIIVFGGTISTLAFIIILLVSSCAILAMMYATNNMLKIHRREIDILGIVGAYDRFIINQIGNVMLKLVGIGAAVGFALGIIAVIGILNVADGQKTGIISQMTINSFDIIRLGLVPVILTGLSYLVSRFFVNRALTGEMFKCS
jgi:cell division protein FtsX